MEQGWLAIGKVNKDYWSMAVCVCGRTKSFSTSSTWRSQTLLGPFFFQPGLKVWVSSNNFTSNVTGKSESIVHELCRNKTKRGPMEFSDSESQQVELLFFLKQQICQGSKSGIITETFWIHILMGEVDLLAGCFLPECAKEAPSSTNRGDGSAFLWLQRVGNRVASSLFGGDILVWMATNPTSDENDVIFTLYHHSEIGTSYFPDAGYVCWVRLAFAKCLNIKLCR